jgi:hypothetical protein
LFTDIAINQRIEVLGDVHMRSRGPAELASTATTGQWTSCSGLM